MTFKLFSRSPEDTRWDCSVTAGDDTTLQRQEYCDLRPASVKARFGPQGAGCRALALVVENLVAGTEAALPALLGLQ